jgi:hypothetical protein
MTSYLDGATMFVEQHRTESVSRAKSAAKGTSYLEALALALGKVADDLGKRIIQQAEKIDGILGRDPKAPVNAETARLQAMTQTYSSLMNAINNVIKTMGEAMSNVSRKGS